MGLTSYKAGKHHHHSQTKAKTISLTPQPKTKEINTNSKCWQGCGETGSLVHYYWECTMAQPLCKTVSQCLIKLHMHLPYGLTIPLVGISAREMETYIHTKTYTQMFTAAQFTVSQNRNQLKCPSIDDWLEKHGYIKTMKYHPAIKRNKQLTDMTTWMHLKLHETKNLKRSK